eukprot:scaffold527_cov368-Prasinococcus_capsulatus_cf.AAC.30
MLVASLCSRSQAQNDSLGRRHTLEGLDWAHMAGQLSPRAHQPGWHLAVATANTCNPCARNTVARGPQLDRRCMRRREECLRDYLPQANLAEDVAREKMRWKIWRRVLQMILFRENDERRAPLPRSLRGVPEEEAALTAFGRPAAAPPALQPRSPPRQHSSQGAPSATSSPLVGVHQASGARQLRSLPMGGGCAGACSPSDSGPLQDVASARARGVARGLAAAALLYDVQRVTAARGPNNRRGALASNGVLACRGARRRLGAKEASGSLLLRSWHSARREKLRPTRDGSWCAAAGTHVLGCDEAAGVGSLAPTVPITQRAGGRACAG